MTLRRALSAVCVTAAVSLAAVTVGGVAGCAADTSDTSDSSRFIVKKGVADDVAAVVVVDTETGVEYLVTGTAVTPLYNDDGSLKTESADTASEKTGRECHNGVQC